MVNNMKRIFLGLLILNFLVSGFAYATGPYTGSAHGNTTSGVDRTSTAQYAIGHCAHCHEAHASIDGSEPAPTGGPDEVLLFDYEENLCETCHDGNPAADNIQAQIDKDSTGSAHPTDNYSGRHSVSESTTTNMDPADYADGVTRHAECVDCHNPHAAGSTVHTLGTNAVGATSPLYKVSGVESPSTTAWGTPNFSDNDEIPTSTGITKEYQLCYKCHSNWTTQPAGQTNIALQFNTNNDSYHSVEGTGKASDYGIYVSTWDKDDRMYCSDCHGSETSSDPAGPHGSTIDHILKGEYNRTTGAHDLNTSSHLCFICHDYDTYRAQNSGSTSTQSGFTTQKSSSYYNLHTYDKHVDAVCMDCHVALPHGINRRHLIVLASDVAPYDNSGQLTNYIPNDTQDYKKSSCSTLTSGCH